MPKVEGKAMDGILAHKDLKVWLGSLMKEGRDVMVPVERDDKVGYEDLAEVGEKKVLLEFHNSHRPPKDIIFPQTEVILRYKREKGDLSIEEVRPEMASTVVFGIRPCDARGVHILDSVFSGSNPDPYYWERRKKVILVGLACKEPHFNCFCTTVGGSPAGTEGLDVLLTEIDDGLYATAVTVRGKELISKGPFKKASDKHRKKAGKVHEEAIGRMARVPEGGPKDPMAVAQLLATVFDDAFWDETSKGCIGCGACTFLCPTCHCFDINDEGSMKEGRRVRTWDTCQYPDFTLHSSSHNPRPIKKHRIRQRVYHKFKYMPETLGMFGCVGCGRCITSCPVNIDIYRIIMDVEEVAE